MKRSILLSMIAMLVGGHALADDDGMKGKLSEKFESADDDGDGKITKDEWSSKAEDRFSERDADGDGRITLTEAREYCEDQLEERFESLDRNDDDVLSSDEVSKMPRGWLSRCDADGDGEVSEDEFEQHASERARCDRGGPMFARADQNGDQAVTEAEHLASSYRYFAKLDRDGSGDVSQDEFHQKVRELRRAKPGERGERTRSRPEPSSKEKPSEAEHEGEPYEGESKEKPSEAEHEGEPYEGESKEKPSEGESKEKPSEGEERPEPPRGEEDPSGELPFDGEAPY